MMRLADPHTTVSRDLGGDGRSEDGLTPLGSSLLGLACFACMDFTQSDLSLAGDRAVPQSDAGTQLYTCQQ
jgi:hypothetical protein